MCVCVDTVTKTEELSALHVTCQEHTEHTLLAVMSSYPRAWKGKQHLTLTVIRRVPAPSHQYLLSTCIYQMQLSHQIKLWVCLSHLHVTLGSKKREKKEVRKITAFVTLHLRTEKLFPKQVSRGNYKGN